MAQPVNKRLVAVIIGLNSLLVPTAITIVIPSLRSLSLELDCDASSAAMIISVCARPPPDRPGTPTPESPAASCRCSAVPAPQGLAVHPLTPPPDP